MRPDIKNLISKEDALKRINEAWKPTAQTEQVQLKDAAGRILAEDQFAQHNLPVVRASAMDGIAVRSADFAEGMPDTNAWKLGEDYVRADTGDDFDDRFDAVIAIENVTFLPDGGLQLPSDVKASKGTNVKPCGSNVKKGALLAPAGKKLTALDLAAIGMGGAACVPVRKRPVVAFVPTGSELVPVGAPLQRGQNFDTNSLLVRQLLLEFGAEPLMHEIVPDSPKQIEAAFNEVLPQADIVLLNAGTSKGQEDYTFRLLEQRGSVLFHGVAAVPGRPMSAAVIDGKPVVNLSGPTFAAFNSMDWAVRNLVSRFLGTTPKKRTVVSATLTEPLRVPPHLSMTTSLHLEKQADGTYAATPIALRGPRAAGTAAALTANAIYLSTPGEEAHAAGETIQVQLL